MESKLLELLSEGVCRRGADPSRAPLLSDSLFKERAAGRRVRPNACSARGGLGGFRSFGWMSFCGSFSFSSCCTTKNALQLYSFLRKTACTKNTETKISGKKPVRLRHQKLRIDLEAHWPMHAQEGHPECCRHVYGCVRVRWSGTCCQCRCMS